MEIEVEVRARVNPTESLEKVERAVRNIFGDLELKTFERRDHSVLEGRTVGLDSLRRFRGLLAKARIRSAARRFLKYRFRDGVFSFGLNKQAAFVNRVSFHQRGAAPLGPIQVRIAGDEETVLYYLCGKIR